MTEIQKELIAIEVIRTLHKQFEKFPDEETNNRNAPFHEAFFKAFARKLEGKVASVPVLISLASWMHGLNTSLGQSFLEKTAHILCQGEKKGFTTTQGTSLQISRNQKRIINQIITDLTNGLRNPNVNQENAECFANAEFEIPATNFTVDVYYQDEEQVVCIESKTVKPNNDIFKVEKEKVLEAKSALKNLYPEKEIIYLLGFPFDPLSESETGYDKQRFMDYCVNFRKYFDETEFLLSSELWDFLSGESNTMETILEIINSIATVDFLNNYEYLNKIENRNNFTEYIELLQKWHLIREIELIENNSIILNSILSNKSLQRIYNQSIFKNDASYNEIRYHVLYELLN